MEAPGNRDWLTWIKVAEKAAHAGANALMGGVESRSLLAATAHDVKLKGDVLAENAILEVLRQESPWLVLSEEAGGDPPFEGGEWMWIVDPLDGTVNYERGIPFFCISIALWRGMEPALGLILDLNNGKIIWGCKSKGTFVGQEIIRVSTIKDPHAAILCTGFPSGTNYNHDALTEFVEWVRNFRKVRLLGSAALSLSLVALGKADAYCERGIRIWDIAAGLAILQAAGGRYKLDPVSDTRFHVLAENGKLGLV